MSKKVVIFLIIGITIGVFMDNLLFKTAKEDISINNPKKENGISMMLETGKETGQYELTTRSEWPTTGYKFNSKLSKCENGGKVSWDNNNKTVLMSGTSSDKCYIYFDVEKFHDTCDPTTLACYVAKKYSGTQGEENLYYHSKNLVNGASDYSYRYAGSNPNNYVCFGTDADICPVDNLYRIIGVFEDTNHGISNEYLVKLIKYDYANSTALGTNGDYEGYGSRTSTLSQYWYRYYWNNNTIDNSWKDSDLNTINLNTNYLNTFTTKWQNMIKEVTWKVGGNTYENIVSTTPKNTLYNEITNPAYNTTYQAKIGLMYVSDYVFADKESSWSENVSEYNYLVDGVTINTNWMYLDVYEWTITKMSNGAKMIYMINYEGKITIYTCGGESINGAAIRPSFYLNSRVTYQSGEGTKDNPIHLNLN